VVDALKTCDGTAVVDIEFALNGLREYGRIS
jgi:hypothetical protein